MAISLASLKPTTAEQPPRVLIYGPPGIGKTSLAAEFPDAAFIRVEDGIPSNVNVMAFPVVETFNDVIQQLGVLYTEEHTYRTVVIDSVTELQRLVFQETCERGDENGNAKTNIEGFGYGKGYTFAKRVMEEIINAINMLRRERGMTVILIAHSHVVRFDDPEHESYDQWSIDLHKQLIGMVEREMDAILLVKTPVDVKVEERGQKGGRAIASAKRLRKIYTEGTPAFVAKNRYGLPSEFRFDPGKGFVTLAPYLPTLKPTPIEPAADEKEAA